MVFILQRARLPAVVFAASVVAMSPWAHGDDGDCKHGGSLRLINGTIHTMDAKNPIVSSVLIKNGRFAAVGYGEGNDDGNCAKTIDLQGRTAVPGIIDSHNHIILLGLRPGRDARLENANSIGEALATLAARAAGRAE